MTVNELLGKIEFRIKELGTLTTHQLRQEHPDCIEGDTYGRPLSKATARLVTNAKRREELIAEIIVEEFSYEPDSEIGDS